MTSRINRAAGVFALAVCISGEVHAAAPGVALPEPKLDMSKAYKLSMENDAKLIESVAAHLNGVAQLQRVIVEDLDWKAPDNPERQHIQEAVKDFKASQVLLNEALTNSGLLVKQLDGEKREQLQLQLQSLKSRTGDLSAKNSTIIKALENQQLPATESMHDLTQSMLAVIGFGIEVAQEKKNKEGKALR